MFITTHRVLCIDVTKDDDGRIIRMRIKNGTEFFTAFVSKKLPNLPDSIREGSQLDISGFIKAKFTEKYGMQFSLTATAVVELGESAGMKSKSVTTEPGAPVAESPKK